MPLDAAERGRRPTTGRCLGEDGLGLDAAAEGGRDTALRGRDGDARVVLPVILDVWLPFV